MEAIEEKRRKVSRSNVGYLILSWFLSIVFFVVGGMTNVDSFIITVASITIPLTISLYILVDELKQTVEWSNEKSEKLINSKIKDLQSQYDRLERSSFDRLEAASEVSRDLYNKIELGFSDVSKSNVALIDNIQNLLERSKVKYFDLMRYAVSLKDDDIPFVWLDICWGIKKKYYALNYEKPIGYQNEQSSVGIPIQNFKSKNGVEVEKIYVIECDSELKELKYVLNSHLESDVKVKYILKSKLDEVRGLSSEHLMSIDFSVVDDNFVIGWKLENRECSGGYLLFSESEMKKYCDYFKRISTVATRLTHYID
ncbi:hypothetical protein [Vibrio fortis]|uniref:hypothetical protein n=1 Tax=Vibrio fortis TaxID=212667 RepID=UPI0038CD8C94